MISQSKDALTSLINVKSLIIVQGDTFSKKNKSTGRESSSISVQVFLRKYVNPHLYFFYCFFYTFDRHVTNKNWQFMFDNFVGFIFKLKVPQNYENFLRSSKLKINKRTGL